MGQVHLHPKLAVLLLLQLKLPHLHSKYEAVNHVVWGLVLDDMLNMVALLLYLAV